MRRIKVLLLGTFLVCAAGGTLLLGPSVSLAQRGEAKSYWRYHEGRWSHWDARDKRWYYTNGEHWFYHNGKKWELYRFDKAFGREGFEQGKYAAPATVVVPAHEVYVHPG